jgi:alanine racemase
MDLIAVDVTAVPDGAVKRGSLVAFLDETLTVDDLAAHAGTIGYEILTSLGRRYHRIYKGGVESAS